MNGEIQQQIETLWAYHDVFRQYWYVQRDAYDTSALIAHTTGDIHRIQIAFETMAKPISKQQLYRETTGFVFLQQLTDDTLRHIYKVPPGRNDLALIQQNIVALFHALQKHAASSRPPPNFIATTWPPPETFATPSMVSVEDTADPTHDLTKKLDGTTLCDA